jgi:hypothetical protein
VGPEDQLDAGLDDAPEAVVDPVAGVWRGLDHELLSGELDWPQGGQPDAVRGLIDCEGKLVLHARPYVLELGAHGSVCPLLSSRK